MWKKAKTPPHFTFLTPPTAHMCRLGSCNENFQFKFSSHLNSFSIQISTTLNFRLSSTASLNYTKETNITLQLFLDGVHRSNSPPKVPYLTGYSKYLIIFLLWAVANPISLIHCASKYESWYLPLTREQDFPKRSCFLWAVNNSPCLFSIRVLYYNPCEMSACNRPSVAQVEQYFCQLLDDLEA